MGFKILIATVLALFSLTAIAHDIEMPPHLRGATVTIVLKDGTTMSQPAERWAVVERAKLTKYKKTYPQPGEKYVDKEREKLPPAPAPQPQPVKEVKKNRFTAHGGIGRQGVIIEEESAHDLTIREANAIVVGASYARMLDEDVSASATVLSNKTFLMGVGVDF